MTSDLMRDVFEGIGDFIADDIVDIVSGETSAIAVCRIHKVVRTMNRLVQSFVLNAAARRIYIVGIVGDWEECCGSRTIVIVVKFGHAESN